MSRMEPRSPGIAPPSFEVEPRAFLLARMPLFAGAWLLSAIAWSVALVVDGGVAIGPIAAAFAAEVLVLAAMWNALRRPRMARSALAVTAGGCVLLGWIVVALFAVTYGLRDVLGVHLLTLYSVPAFAFAWGWWIELLLVGSTLPTAVAALPWLAPSSQPTELVMAVILGTGVSFAVAELTARGLREAHAQRQAADERARELAASRDAYRDLAENVRDFIWSVDLDGRWTYMNAAFERFFGVARGAMIGRPSTERTIDHPAAANVAEEIRNVVAGDTPGPLRFCFDLPGGPRWVEALASPVHAADGSVVAIRGVSRDVTERVVLDARLRESEAKFRVVAEAMAAPVFLVRGTEVLYVNAACFRVLGYSYAEMRAMPFWRIVHPDDRPLVRARAEARQRGETIPPAQEYRVVTKSGETRWIVFDAVLIDYGGSPAILGNAIDVTERKHAEEALRASLAELRASEERLRLLARRQVAIREEERTRIGFDLHDGVCQELIGVGIMIASVRERLQPDAHEAAAAIGRAVGYVNDVVEHLRMLARELRPMLLHDLGLEASLGSLAAGLSTPERPVTIRIAMPIPRLGEDVELAVYRIAQEALTNAVRHADAATIVLSLATHDGSVRLEVRDDGRGFDPAQRSSPALGLAGMHERAIALGGRFTIASTPGGGTTVSVAWPVVRTAAAG